MNNHRNKYYNHRYTKKLSIYIFQFLIILLITVSINKAQDVIVDNGMVVGAEDKAVKSDTE